MRGGGLTIVLASTASHKSEKLSIEFARSFQPRWYLVRLVWLACIMHHTIMIPEGTGTISSKKHPDDASLKVLKT
jgi:hypothetical protein